MQTKEEFEYNKAKKYIAAVRNNLDITYDDFDPFKLVMCDVIVSLYEQNIELKKKLGF